MIDWGLRDATRVMAAIALVLLVLGAVAIYLFVGRTHVYRANRPGRASRAKQIVAADGRPGAVSAS